MDNRGCAIFLPVLQFAAKPVQMLLPSGLCTGLAGMQRASHRPFPIKPSVSHYRGFFLSATPTVSDPNSKRQPNVSYGRSTLLAAQNVSNATVAMRAIATTFFGYHLISLDNLIAGKALSTLN